MHDGGEHELAQMRRALAAAARAPDMHLCDHLTELAANCLELAIAQDADEQTTHTHRCYYFGVPREWRLCKDCNQG